MPSTVLKSPLRILTILPSGTLLTTAAVVVGSLRIFKPPAPTPTTLAVTSAALAVAVGAGATVAVATEFERVAVGVPFLVPFTTSTVCPAVAPGVVLPNNPLLGVVVAVGLGLLSFLPPNTLSKTTTSRIKRTAQGNTFR